MEGNRKANGNSEESFIDQVLHPSASQAMDKGKGARSKKLWLAFTRPFSMYLRMAHCSPQRKNALWAGRRLSVSPNAIDEVMLHSAFAIDTINGECRSRVNRPTIPQV